MERRGGRDEDGAGNSAERGTAPGAGGPRPPQSETSEAPPTPGGPPEDRAERGGGSRAPGSESDRGTRASARRGPPRDPHAPAGGAARAGGPKGAGVRNLGPLPRKVGTSTSHPPAGPGSEAGRPRSPRRANRAAHLGPERGGGGRRAAARGRGESPTPISPGGWLPLPILDTRTLFRQEPRG